MNYIPKRTGKGKEEWHWTGEFWESAIFTRAHVLSAKESFVGERGYFFSQESVCLGGVDNHPNYLTPDVMRGFLILIENNPELLPPTETYKGESDA